MSPLTRETLAIRLMTRRQIAHRLVKTLETSALSETTSHAHSYSLM